MTYSKATRGCSFVHSLTQLNTFNKMYNDSYQDESEVLTVLRNVLALWGGDFTYKIIIGHPKPTQCRCAKEHESERGEISKLEPSKTGIPVPFYQAKDSRTLHIPSKLVRCVPTPGVGLCDLATPSHSSLHQEMKVFHFCSFLQPLLWATAHILSEGQGSLLRLPSYLSESLLQLLLLKILE